MTVTFDGVLAALRSGEFEQTRGVLHVGDCYCAAGVICELVRRDDPENYRWVVAKDVAPDDLSIPHDRYGDTIYAFEHRHPGEDGYFLVVDHPMGRDTFGKIDPVVADVNEILRLNDVQGCTLPQIADFLEKRKRNRDALQERIDRDHAEFKEMYP